ncbi:hypothetical protein CTI14_45845, partial [Methylobacterium radiotolerans]
MDGGEGADAKVSGMTKGQHAALACQQVADTPASPPKTLFRCGASACSSSASASVIIEKYT